MSLDALYTHDLSGQIAALPRQPHAQAMLPRPRIEWNTFHYSGVVYRDRSEPTELAHIITEARDHLRRNWARKGTPPIYGSTYMYDVAVLSSGAIVKLQQRPLQLWHAGNALANRLSFSTHVLLGKGQDLTEPQRASLWRVFDALGLPRERHVAHCEWPRNDGMPLLSEKYRLLPGQSECPNTILHAQLVRYRAPVDPWDAWGTLVPIPPKEWGVPRVWLANPWLGVCLEEETYTKDDTKSITRFRNGVIVHYKASGETLAYRKV